MATLPMSSCNVTKEPVRNRSVCTDTVADPGGGLRGLKTPPLGPTSYE